jgi:hypothetical protein
MILFVQYVLKVTKKEGSRRAFQPFLEMASVLAGADHVDAKVVEGNVTCARFWRR